MDDVAIEELFEGLGTVSIRRMFGGKGIYHRGLIIAVHLHDELMLKADGESGADFAAAGARQWSYEGKKGRPVMMPYWTVPEEALDDPDVMTKWARLAYEASLRASSKAV
jgi:DNA transformation protein